MPDHLHVLVVAQSDQADMLSFVKPYKQMTGFAYRRDHDQPLWQPGYHERVLRGDEATEAVVAYILENPADKGVTVQFCKRASLVH